MYKRNVSIAILCSALFASLAVLAPNLQAQTVPGQPPTTTPVIIRVSDQTGAGIARAQVRLVPSPDQAPAKLETDDHGQLSLNLKTGGYALFVSAQGFTKDARHIDVRIAEGQANAGQIVTVVLEVGHGGGVTVSPAAPGAGLVLSAEPYNAVVVISPADFHALPHITITVHNGHTNADETYSGVPLATLLAKVNAPIGRELRGEAMTSYLIATGSDGYSVVLSLAEVDPSFHEGQVLVADTRDGKPLGSNGPFQLIVPDDKRPARWVHNLASITLQR
jgi:hypothetical protein